MQEFSPSGKNIRKKLQLGNSFECLTFGRAAPSKGIEYAVESARLMKNPKIKYVFIISDDYSKRYKSIAEKIKKMANSILLKPVPYKELPEYIAASDCVIVPSLSEGFGYAAAESCAMGKIVIASNTTSLPEIVSGRYLLVPPKNPKAIAEAVEKAYHWKYIKSKPKRFTIEENVKKHIEVYKNLLRKV